MKANFEGQPVAHILAALRKHGLDELAEKIARRHHLHVEQVVGRSRAHPFIHARQELWAHAYERIRSYPVLGAIFDRDHTTIRDGVVAHLGREPEQQTFSFDKRRDGR